jgi:hypothetical protein
MFCLCISVLGQTQTVTKTPKKSKTFVEVQNTIKSFKNAVDFVASYDKFDDKTTVLVKFGSPQVNKLSAYDIKTMAWVLSSTFAGKGISKQPVSSRLCFDATADHTINFAKTKEIVFLIDDTRLAVGRTGYNLKWLPPGRAMAMIFGQLMEQVCWNLNARQLSALLNAKSIEFKAEPITGFFSENQLLAIKDFQKLIF